MTQTPLLEVSGLAKYFAVKRDFWGRPVSWLKAVDGVSFAVGRAEVFSLVGESGCGKTTVGKMICGLLLPTSGRISFDGRDLTRQTARERRALSRDIQFIFQDPYASLNPRMTIGRIIMEPILIHHLLPRDEAEKRVDELLDCVGLSPHHKHRYPHEFSGGQRQRAGIARAMALNPKCIVCDEPISALDVSIQAQILNLLSDLKAAFGLTYIFIAHGLGAVKHLSDRVAVMYLGKLMELAPKRELYANPLHPYTRALLSAIPIPDPEAKRERIRLTGDAPSPVDPPPGCRYAPRCPARRGICAREEPALREAAPGHYLACYDR